MTGIRPPKPPAIVVSGPPASGKSALGAALAASLGGALLDQDVVTRPLTAVVAELLGAGDDLDHAGMRSRSRDARYETILAAAADNLRLGTPVVLVAPFTAEREEPARWARLRERLRQAGGEPRLVWVRIEADELVRRLVRRDAARDRGKLADVASFLAAGPTRPPAVDHTTVDASWPVREQVQAVLGPPPDKGP